MFKYLRGQLLCYSVLYFKIFQKTPCVRMSKGQLLCYSVLNCKIFQNTPCVRMSKGYTGVHAAVKFKRGIRPKHNVTNGILGELQHNNILLRLALLLI